MEWDWTDSYLEVFDQENVSDLNYNDFIDSIWKVMAECIDLRDMENAIFMFKA